MKSIAFFGSDRFSQITLTSFLSALPCPSADLLKVYTPPDQAGALLKYCVKEGIKHEILPPKTLRDFRLGEEHDIGLVASIGYFIPGRIIRSFRQGIINAHPSLLPKYRGASPLQHTIMSGDTKTGVTIIDLDSKSFDAGNIWSQQQVEINAYPDFTTLEEQLAQLSGKLFYEAYCNFPSYQQGCQPQDENGVSYAPKIERQDAAISFANDPMWRIFGKYQAIRHQEPLHFTAANKDCFLVEMADPRMVQPTMSPDQFVPLAKPAPPGAIFWDRPAKILWIKCQDGLWLPAKKFRIRGKSNTFDPGNFLNSLFKPGEVVNFIKSMLP